MSNADRLHATDDQDASAFYGFVIRTLKAARVRFLVAGTYAFEHYAGYSRGTKDLDVFILPEDWPRVVAAAERAGLQAELKFSHWLGKIMSSDHFVDFVFAGGNGLVRVEQDWFDHGIDANVCGERVQLCAAEEILWSKSFIMERERFDGADVLHMIRAGGQTLDWARILRRFGDHWRVLLAHLVLFGYVYPGDCDAIPPSVLPLLVARLGEDEQKPTDERVCRGPLLSRLQYLVDVTEWAYADPRRAPDGTMSDGQIAEWTDAALRETAPSDLPSTAASQKTRRAS
jgi:hypothetical protein